MTIFDKVIDSYSKKLPFSVYRKPNSEELLGFFMRDDSLVYVDDFSENGFVFAPFNANENAILFPLKKSDFLCEVIDLEGIGFEENIVKTEKNSETKHIKLVQKTIQKIRNSELQKVVISRKENVELKNFDLLNVFKKLILSYKGAFVSAWFHPKVGLWLGATPETLLQKKGSRFKTMSLAGTQVFKSTDKIVWKSKELNEQQLVTTFIENQLEDISSDLKIDKTETVRAGNLLHLRTKVEGVLNENANLKELVRALHPTPAVCGLPRNLSKSFILENENYNRAFYTGFLGELNVNKKTSLFVNLRCMEITQKEAAVFVGGGITKDSNAEKEWLETVSKSKTMKKVL